MIAPSPKLDVRSLNNGDTVVLQSNKYKKEKKIDYFKEIRGIPVFKFSDTNTINDAFKLVGYSLYAIQTNTTGSKSSSVVNFMVKDMDGHLWGMVKGLDTSGLNQLLEVENPEGDIIYVPFADAIVKEIDEVKQVIRINPPQGLKDLNKT